MHFEPSKEWIEERISKRNYEKNFYPWKNKQISGMLPKNYNKLNFNITYFQTSEYEFLGIPENEVGLEFKNNLIIYLIYCDNLFDMYEILFPLLTKSLT